MTRPAWTADDIGRTGPATLPVQHHPAEAATDLGIDDEQHDPHAAARGVVLAVLAGLLVLLAAATAVLWGRA